MRMAPMYAVLFGGEWNICYLVLCTEYTNDDTPWSDTPMWSRVHDTAQICPFDVADHVIPLKEPF